MEQGKAAYKRSGFKNISTTFLNLVFERGIFIITLPYYLLYDRTTKSRIIAICRASDDTEAGDLLQKWLMMKNREAQYVQVAGAVTFASTISSLSWNNIDERHWTVSACWFTSIVFAFTAVISGAQQTILLESLQCASVRTVKAHLCDSSNRIAWSAVFAWQCPLMFLAYALLFYVAGLTSYVVSPVVQERIWNNNAKTLLFYTITALTAFIVFVCSSRKVHHTLPEIGNFQEPGDVSIKGECLRTAQTSHL